MQKFRQDDTLRSRLERHLLEGVDLAAEEYAIGFRVGSDMTAKVNAVISDMINDGSLEKLAIKYDMLDLYEQAVK